jgi:hypothetical protein
VSRLLGQATIGSVEGLQVFARAPGTSACYLQMQ